MSIHGFFRSAPLFGFVLPLTVLFFVLLALFQWRQSRLDVEEEVLDARFGYTVQEVAGYFERIGPDGRRLYARTQLSLDVLFPAVYGLLLLLFLARLYDGRAALWLMTLPPLAAVADLVENLILAYLASTAPAPSAVWIASLCTRAKIVLIGLSLAAVAAGLIARLGTRPAR